MAVTGIAPPAEPGRAHGQAELVSDRSWHVDDELAGDRRADVDVPAAQRHVRSPGALFTLISRAVRKMRANKKTTGQYLTPAARAGWLVALFTLAGFVVAVHVPRVLAWWAVGVSIPAGIMAARACARRARTRKEKSSS